MKITICGSLRFEDEIQAWHEDLALQGHIIYSTVVYPSMKGGNKDWYTPHQKTMLDLVHLAKISNSDGVLVVDQPLMCYNNINDEETQDFPCPYGNMCERYIGESTRREIEWAYIQNKRVYIASVQLYFGKLDDNTIDEARRLINNTRRVTFRGMFPYV